MRHLRALFPSAGTLAAAVLLAASCAPPKDDERMKAPAGELSLTRKDPAK